MTWEVLWSCADPFGNLRCCRRRCKSYDEAVFEAAKLVLEAAAQNPQPVLVPKWVFKGER